MLYPAYQYDVVAATKIVYQTITTASVYQAPLALFHPALAALAVLAISGLTSFAAFL